MQEIIFDTETTGLSPSEGHRIIEIGCLEIADLVPTGNHFQVYINPERVVPDEAIRIHGITNEYLADKPVFAHPAVVDAFLEFVGDRPLVAHNADFDKGFINAELARLGRKKLPDSQFIDTRVLARARFPGLSNSLDSLCKRFGVSLAGRTYHGALKDAELLAAVYLELRGGREQGLDFSTGQGGTTGKRQAARARGKILASRISQAEKSAHDQFLTELGALEHWRRALGSDPTS